MNSVTVDNSVPLCDLRQQWATIQDEVRAAIDEVFDSQAFIQGPQVAQFEERIASYCDCRHAIGCSSGSDALLLALMALEICSGDEVITTPYTFFATAGAIVRLGAKPVFVDIDATTFNIDPVQLDRAITARTKAVIPVHLFGQTADMDPIGQLARQHGLSVIEDAAQAIGARYKERKAGSFGDAGCFSFFPSKNLGAAGDGGMVVTNNGALAERLRQLRNHGAKQKYHHPRVGGNFRLDTIQAALLLVKLRYLDKWNTARRQRAANYRRLIENSAAADVCSPPEEAADRHHVYHQYVIRSDRRDALAGELGSRGIATAVYYPVPLHLQDCFRELGYSPGSLPESERASHQSLALPMFPELTEQQQARIISAVCAVAETQLAT